MTKRTIIPDIINGFSYLYSHIRTTSPQPCK